MEIKDSPQINWPLLCRVRLAMYDLQACQDLIFKGQPVCFASLIDAQQMIGEAIEQTQQQMREVARDQVRVDKF